MTPIVLPIVDRAQRAADADTVNLNPAAQRLALIGILLGTFLAYAPTLRYQFVYDDDSQILNNPHLQSWKFLPLYFTSHVWSQAFPGAAGWNYRPLFLLWLRLNYAVFGPRAAGWHLTTIALHLVVVGLVFLVVLRLGKDTWLAGLAALIFGLHPAHIEAVAWISGVTEPLCATFFLLAFLFYLQGRESPHFAWTVGALAAFVLAVLSKETAFVLPVLIFLHAWLFPAGGAPHAKARWRLLDAAKVIALYVLLATALGAGRWAVLHGPGRPLTQMPWTWVVLTAPSLLVFYARHFVLPVRLSAFYDLAYVTRLNVTEVLLGSLLVLLALGRWWWSRRSRLVAFGSLWMIVTLVPALNVKYFTFGELAHDRYLYLPSVGFSLLVAVGIRQLSGTEGRRAGSRTLGAAALLTLWMGLGVFLQERYWADDFSLYQWGVERAPGNIFARRSYANLLGQQGRVDEAITQYRILLERYPNDAGSIDDLGWIYYQTGRLQEAEQYLGQAVELQPQNAAAVLYLGLTRMRRGKLDDAATLVRRAVEMQPQTPGYHFALGTILENQGKLNDALEAFRAELAVSPQQVRAQEAIDRIEAGKRRSRSGPNSQGSSPEQRGSKVIR